MTTVISINSVPLDIAPAEPMSTQETLALYYYGRRKMWAREIAEKLGVTSHEALMLACRGALKAERIVRQSEAL